MITADEHAALLKLKMDEAMMFLADLKEACEGVVIEPLSNTDFKGVVNIGNSCYLGDLVTSPYMVHLRLSLQRYGWFGSGPASAIHMSSQQDASELFLFLMDALGAPFLPLQSELFHGGRHSSDDSRMFTERLIQISVADSADAGVLFEDLLYDHFFDNHVQVERDSEAGNEAGPSIQISVDGASNGASTSSSATSAAAKKAVEAWQSSRLLPFLTPQSESGDRSRDIPLERSATVTVPFIIKRYSFNHQNGVSTRIGRRVYIPTEIPFGQFVVRNPHSVSSDDFTNPSEYTLRLRSVLCHEGTDPRRGHYTAIVSRRAHQDEALEALDQAASYDDLSIVTSVPSASATVPPFSRPRASQPIAINNSNGIGQRSTSKLSIRSASPVSPLRYSTIARSRSKSLKAALSVDLMDAYDRY
eukprot:jgi/Hompol1/2936/HPOL_006235-RA